MKHAVSVSLGSSKRDKSAVISLLGTDVKLERIGTDGDAKRAAEMFVDLDGKVDALGVGGIDLWVQVEEKYHMISAAYRLVERVKTTPVVDGGGLKSTLEYGVADALAEQLGMDVAGKNVLITAASDRYGMTRSFADAGANILAGDLGFALGINYPMRSLEQIKKVTRFVLPIATKLPISVLYPTGEKQEQIVPKFQDWYDWADIIAGDCLYIKQHMPDDLSGKIIVTNTTTEQDRKLFQARGVTHIMTTTPAIEGRTFGTNLMEAGLTAVFGNGTALSQEELKDILQQLDLKPTLHTLH